MALRYRSSDPVPEGLPLGGLGCGALQVFPDGTRGLFTGLNNWEQPLGFLHWFRGAGTGSDYRVANPFAVFVDDGRKRRAWLLQTQPVAGLPAVKRVRMEADFPVAELFIEDPRIPVELSATVFSGFLPGKPEESEIPGVAYLWRVRNPLRRPVTIGLMASAINPVGSWNVSRYNLVQRRDGLLGVECHRRRPKRHDPREGVVLLAAGGCPGGTLSYHGSWSYAGSPFSGRQEDRRIEAWAAFSRDGRLTNDATVREAYGETDEPMGALAVTLTLPPGGRAEWPVYYVWHMPRHPHGHHYVKTYPSAWDAALHLHRRRGRLLSGIRDWQRTIRSGPWPEWLSDGLINSLCVYTAASWWTRDGLYTIYENPVKWPLMDSLDVRYYGTLPLVFMFPGLERSTLRQFKRLQRPDGRIPHDLGKSQIDCPSDGTTAGLPWKDLATKYALMVWRNALWTRDSSWVEEFYPSVKRAMRWQFATDTNGDGLPDNEGLDSTYDVWHFYGTGSYTSSIHLAALAATAAMAEAAGDAPFARSCRERLAVGQRSFEAQLWNGEYYIAARERSGEAYEACIAGQLNGQWYAHLLGLGYLLPRAHVRRAVATMLRLNGGASRFGAVNSVMPDGVVDQRSQHAANIWVGETYALAALAIHEGLVKDGLALGQRMWRLWADRIRRPWSQSDVVSADEGRPADGELYLRSLAIWAIPFALAAHRPAAWAVLEALGLQRPSARRGRAVLFSSNGSTTEPRPVGNGRVVRNRIVRPASSRTASPS